MNTDLATDESLTAGPGGLEFYPGPVGHGRFMAFDRHQNFGSADFLENKWIQFHNFCKCIYIYKS